MTAACVSAAICWLSLCLDWEIAMYATGLVALASVVVLNSKKKSLREKGKEGDI